MPKKHQMDDNEFKIHKAEHSTFLWIKSTGKTLFKFQVSQRMLILGLVMIAATILLSISAGIYSSVIASEHTELDDLRRKTTEQELELNAIEDRVQVLASSLEAMLEKESEVRTLLKIKSKKKRRRRLTKHQKVARKFKKEFATQFSQDKPQKERVLSGLDLIQDRMLQLETGMVAIEKRVAMYKQRYLSVPSIWPVYGRIRSTYGWRIHPKTGRRQFHKGIDIPSWIGAPIHATADGVVEFSGWGGGYGWLVILAHEYGGFRTIYAHMSDRLVSKGMLVKKGQVIGSVGQSGLTTGPHVHYEVRRWNSAVSPKKYLGLDLFTASTRLW